MMKKVLFVAAVAMSLVFSGCMKEDDTYKKLKPVQPGLNIYTGAMNQNIVSMQQANFGLRLAMLVAEADKQQKTIDEVTVGSSNTLLKRQLLGNAKVETTANGYKITFDADYADLDTYVRKGTLLINTNETALLKDATESKPWIVTFEDKLTMGYSGGDMQAITLTGGLTKLYFVESSGAYGIGLEAQQSYVGKTEELTSNWNGKFTVKPENVNFTYTDCAGKKFMLNGTATGRTFNTYDGISATTMSLRMTNGEYYSSSALYGGKIEASLGDGYNPSLYPSKDVIVEITLEGTRLRQTITYSRSRRDGLGNFIRMKKSGACRPRSFFVALYFRRQEDCRSSRMTEGMQNATSPMQQMTVPAMTKVVVRPTCSARKPVPSSPIAEGSSPKL